jgi:dihydroflavonol-4-reductase
VTETPGASPGVAVVTGSSGFVGRVLVRHLLEAGWSVRTVARRPLEGRDARRVDHTVADVRDRESLVPVFAGAAVVYHLAARITLASADAEARDINVRGPAAVAAAALDAGVARLVHCSSVQAFDLRRSLPRLDETSPRATHPDRPVYDRSKAAGEIEVRKAIEAGLDATIVNPTGILGPGDAGLSRINAIVVRAAQGRLPLVVEGGFDWVDVRDVVQGLVAASAKGRTGENYLLPGHRASALRLARLAAAANGRSGPVAALPEGVARRVAPLAELIGRVFHSEVFTPASIRTLADSPDVDGSKAAVELDHRPRPLDESVRDTVQWFRDTGRL